MIRNALSSRLLRVLSGAVLSQAILSAANFLVGLMLIRYTSDHVYGTYVLAFYLVQLLATIQGAAVTGPLSVIASKKDDVQRHQMVGDVLLAQTLGVRRVAYAVLLVAVAGGVLGVFSHMLCAVIVATTLAGWAALRREYLRIVLMMDAKAALILRGDLLYVGLLLGVMLLGTLHLEWAAPVSVLALAAAANFSALYYGRVMKRARAWGATDTTQLGLWWREMWPIGRWALVGAIIYWIFSQGYNYILALKLDLVAVAAINAARLLLMPTYLLSTGVKGMMLPQSVRWLQEQGFTALIKRQTAIVGVLILLFGVYFVFLWLAHDWIFAEIMRKEIPDHVFLLTGWATLSMLNLIRDTYQNALIARERLRALAWLAALSTAAAMTTLWLALDVMGLRGAMYGLIAGELVNTAGVILLCAWEVRRLAKSG